MITIEKSFHINKPPADVFAFMSDFSNDTKWQSDVIRSEKTSAGPMGVGTTGLTVQKFMGKEMQNDLVVTAHEVPKRFGLKTTSGPVQFELLGAFEEKDGGTDLALTIHAEPGGFFKLAEGLLKGELAKSLDRDFAKLKQILEG